MPDDDRIAERLIGMMRDAGRDALEAVGEELKRMTILDLPVGDPTLDPDPAYALRDHVVVRRYGNIVSVAVEGDYALKQHESLYLRHVRGGNSKFLERNAVRIVAAMQQELEGTISRRFQDGRDRTVVTAIGTNTNTNPHQ